MLLMVRKQGILWERTFLTARNCRYPHRKKHWADICNLRRIRKVRIESLTQYCTVSQGDRETIEIDRPVVGKRGNGAVFGKRPCTTGFNCHNSIIRYGGAILCIFHDIDGSGKTAFARKSYIQGGNGIYNNIAFKGLPIDREYYLRSVLSGCSPSMISTVPTDVHQITRLILVCNFHIGQVNRAGSIGYIEHVAVIG